MRTGIVWWTCVALSLTACSDKRTSRSSDTQDSDVAASIVEIPRRACNAGDIEVEIASPPTTPECSFVVDNPDVLWAVSHWVDLEQAGLTLRLPETSGADGCGNAHGWYFTGTVTELRVAMCPETCKLLDKVVVHVNWSCDPEPPEPILADCINDTYKCESSSRLLYCEDGEWTVAAECTAPEVCNEQQATCSVPICPPFGTGRDVGDRIANMSFKADTGGSYQLHSLCGEGEAIVLMLTTSWCGACSQFAPTFQGWANDLTSKGGHFVVVVGEDNSGGPATAQTASAYRAKHGYNDRVVVVSDPGFTTVASKIDVGSSLSLPYLIVLRSDMTLEYVHKNPQFQVAYDILQSLTNSAL